MAKAGRYVGWLNMQREQKKRSSKSAHHPGENQTAATALKDIDKSMITKTGQP